MNGNYKQKVGDYYYRIKGNFYRIFRVTEQTECTQSADLVPGEEWYTNPHDARKRVYELNGWKGYTSDKTKG